MIFLGVDLAWGLGTGTRVAANSGVAALDESGRIRNAGWTVGISETLDWITRSAEANTLLFVDAPLIVNNAAGQRLCETHVGQRYHRWKVFAHSTNTGSRHVGGVRLREELEVHGWRYSSGRTGPPTAGRVVSECYPHTTIVGVPELGYEDERPAYKAKWRALRADACDELIRRVDSLSSFDPPLDVRSNVETCRLLDDPSPAGTTAYKKREDLLDAVICAWTAAYWWRHGLARCQVLGTDAADGVEEPATIIAPARPGQRA